MNAKKILTSLLPWLVFSLLAERHGSHAAAVAALVSAAFAAAIAGRNKGTAGVRIIDAAGVVCFTVLAVVAFAAGGSVDRSAVALVAGIGHTYAGYRLAHGACPIALRLVLNWGVPLVLGLAALNYTTKLAGANTAPAALAA